MAPKEKQKIEIEKSHRDPLLSFNQAVTVDCSDFLGTALMYILIFLRQFIIPVRPAWDHHVGALFVGLLGLVSFVWRD
jgi:hypothetical protein